MQSTFYLWIGKVLLDWITKEPRHDNGTYLEGGWRIPKGPSRRHLVSFTRLPQKECIYRQVSVLMVANSVASRLRSATAQTLIACRTVHSLIKAHRLNIMSYNSNGYTGVLPSASGQPSGTAPTSLSAQQDSTVNDLTGSLESRLSNGTADVTVPVVVLELQIRHEELFFERAEQDQERGAAIEVCDLCHIIAAEWAYPTQGYPSRPKYNFDASLSEYNKKHRTNLPDATTFNEFPDLKAGRGHMAMPPQLDLCRCSLQTPVRVR